MIEEAVSIQGLVREHPQTRPILEKFGIDPDEQNTLAAAASESEVSIRHLIAALNEIIDAPPAGDDVPGDWFAVGPKALIDYIEGRHHTYMKRELPRLERLLERVMQTHRRRHGKMLGALRAVFASFKTEIEEHLRIEEQILFPRICDVDRRQRGQGSSGRTGWTSVDVTAMQQMQHEHVLAETALNEFRELTSDYSLPEDACEQFAALYEGLTALEADLHEHIDLENDLLWPVRQRAVASGSPNPGSSLRSLSEVPSDICPLTGKPCEAGSHAMCRHFWDCVVQVIAREQTE